MHKQTVFILMVFMAISVLGAVQNLAIGLNTPSMLTNWQGEINIGHRFYGQFNHEPFDTFLGTSWGANTNISYRQHLLMGTEVKLGYTSANKQYEAGAAWSFVPETLPLRAQVDVTYASFVKPLSTDRDTDIGVMLSAQNEQLWDCLTLTLNVGYNTYYQKAAFGAGADVLITNMITDGIHLLGEYYPMMSETNESDNPYLVGKHNSWAAGIEVDTWGHSFIFSVGNDPFHFSTPQLSLGTTTKGVPYLGFNIKRRINF